MKKYSSLLTIFVALLLVFTSCATIFLGSTQKVNLESNPPYAQVYLNGENTGRTTPCQIEVTRRVKASEHNRKREQVYRFAKEGYHDLEVKDEGSIHWLYVLDWFYYLVPGVIDLASGATHHYDRNVNVALNPVDGFKPKPTLATLPKEPVEERVQHEYVTEKQTQYQKPVTAPSITGRNGYVFERKSGVDKNIPNSQKQHNNRFALIIGNEDYSSFQLDLNAEVNVAYARNDASAFKLYAQHTLGIPEEHIIFLLDGTTGQMSQAIAKMNLLIKNTNGKADVFVYYAGHGFPDEVTQTPYLMPVDVSGKNPQSGIMLKDFYHKLTEYPAHRVTVFIDACFSGGARNQGLLAARGVKIKPREDQLKGALVSFTASSGTQSSLPLDKEHHGLFTYYLLKKLQETGGKVSYDELSSYLAQKVSLQSVLLNDKEQTPKTNISPGLQNKWESWMLND
ncbi:MAG: caspase family protein [Salinivirgaceae bacterium]